MQEREEGGYLSDERPIVGGSWLLGCWPEFVFVFAIVFVFVIVFVCVLIYYINLNPSLATETCPVLAVSPFSAKDEMPEK